MTASVLTARLRRDLKARYDGLTPFARRVRRELPSHLARLRATTGELDSAMAEIERRFLKISGGLETTTEMGRGLVERGEALIALALGQGGGEIIIDTTAEHIWRVVEFVERNVGESEELVRQLNTAHQQLGSTLAAEEALTRTLAPLTYMQTLFRVESGALAPDVQTMFHALVLDIERVRLHVEGGFREKFQLIRQIQTILNRVIVHLDEKGAQAKRSVAALRDDLTRSLTTMKACYGRNRDRDTRLADVSRKVTSETGRIVISLQFQDVLNQRLQHTRKILAEITPRLQSPPGGRVETARTLRFLEQAGLVGAAQIGSMNDELMRAGPAVATGLDEIMRQMAALDGDCIALRDLDNVTTGVDGAVQILLDSLADVQRLVGEAEDFAMESYRTIEPIGGMTTNFTAFIRNLSFEIQLIGLNAEVQSAHIGRGTGLEVLSAQTSAISRETTELSTRLAVELDSLTSGLATMVVSFREIRERSVGFNQKLKADAAGQNASLHAYRNQALTILHQIGEMLPQLREQVGSATAQAEFVNIAHEPLARLQGALASLASSAQALAERATVTVDTAGLTDHFFAFYTMSAEGDVHRQALGAPAPAPDPAADPVGAIDLFGEQAAAPAASPETAENIPVPLDAPVTTEADLWLDPVAPSADAPTPSPDSAEVARPRAN